MASIQFTDRGTALRVSPRGRALAQGAAAAAATPSLLNTQPWRWRITGDTAELRLDRSRQAVALDPDARLLTLSCGVALHHARIALAADGVEVDVRYLPDDADPDLLASVKCRGFTVHTTPEAQRLRRAMAIRRSDRRPFADRAVPTDALDRLRAAAETQGGHLFFPRPRDLVTLTVAAGHAAAAELADPAYRAELAEWVHRSGDSDGVPPGTTVPMAARPVPVRDFTATGAQRTTLHDPLVLADRFARYAVVFTDGDQPRDWIRAGETVSAVLLAATAEGLATSVMSDLVEVPAARALLRDLLSGIGYPAIAIRVGVPATGTPPPSAPRRPGYETVEVVAEPIHATETGDPHSAKEAG
jgi:nitroreductase